ncbi:MAG: glycosyltransferase family 4 protein [Candidatus Cloacimonetes bacterium]|nr:glycosyltransferase family 4 protein [Candidatus Cloacimonadota bacterium]
MRKKIAHFQLLPILSGVQNIMLTLLTHLDPEKYEIYVISKSGGPLVDKVKELGFKHIPLKYLRRKLSPLDIVAFFELIRIFKENNFDIIHTHSSKPGFIGRIAAKLAGCRAVVHTVHGLPFREFQNKLVYFFYLHLERIAARFSDITIFVNNHERELCWEKKVYLPKNSLTIHNSVVSHRYNGIKTLGELITITSVCRFFPPKNIVNTVLCAIKACKLNDKLRFVFVGDGKYYDKCLRLVRENHCDDKINLPGWQSNVYDWLKESDVFLLYSLSEGFPISILEAMSMKLPIIGSDIKSIREMVSEKNGYLVDPFDHEKLVNLLTGLTDERNVLILKGEESYNLVCNKFSLESFINGYEKIYEKLVS